MNSSELSDIDFEKISHLIYQQCGINLHEGKKELVKARLGKRLREGNFRSFSEYYKHVTTREGTDELITMIDSISTNLTTFLEKTLISRDYRPSLNPFWKVLPGREAGHRD